MIGNDRLHALDAVRAFALLAGIVLHSTMSFFLPIPALDNSQSETLAVLFFVIHVFRMSLFFVMAGFFAHLVFHRKGFVLFVKDRAIRIVVPMIVGWLILAPILGLLTLRGLTKTFGPEVLASMEGVASPVPLTHLWFLYYLCIFYVCFLALRWIFVNALDGSERIRTAIDRSVAISLSTHFAPLLLALPTALVFNFDATWAASPWTGIPTPDMGFTPKVPAMVGYGVAFGFGWVLQRQTHLLAIWQKRWVSNLVLAVVLTVAALLLVGNLPTAVSPFAETDSPWQKLLYIVCYTLAAWYWCFGLIGVALRFFSERSAVQRYLADSSYWLYLMHLPIVFLLQVSLMQVNLHWSLKFPLILLITMTTLLVTYHYLVRSSFIGQILNGRKYYRNGSTSNGSTSSPMAPDPKLARGRRDAEPLATLDNVSKRFGNIVALNSVTLEVRRGELLAVLGPNGAGKSTAISLWLGMDSPDAGLVQIMGASPLERASRLDVGVMMQEVSLAAELTAREQIALTASYYPNPLTVDEVIALAQIEELADRRYGRMSTGQKRQVQFATALCGRPQLLFMDEPTVGLDVQARERMWRIIQRLVAQGCSIVLTTHYLEEAEALADRVAVLNNGSLIALGSVDDIRSLVTRKQIKCQCDIDLDEIRCWPGVASADRDAHGVNIAATDAEDIVRRLLAADVALSHLEVKQATLAEAFTHITKEAA